MEITQLSLPVLFGDCDFCREGDFLQQFDLYQMSYLHQLAVSKLSFGFCLVAFPGTDMEKLLTSYEEMSCCILLDQWEKLDIC